MLGQRPHLFLVVAVGEALESSWRELAACWVQLDDVVFGEVRSERVDCDDERASVRLELSTGVEPSLSFVRNFVL